LFIQSGLGFRPRPRDENVESTLIWFKQGQNEQNWKHWTDNLVKFLERKFHLISYYNHSCFSQTITHLSIDFISSNISPLNMYRSTSSNLTLSIFYSTSANKTFSTHILFLCLKSFAIIVCEIWIWFEVLVTTIGRSTFN